MTEQPIKLVADIGGTNIRLGVVKSNASDVSNLQVYQCADYAGLADVIKTYLAHYQLENRAINACFAIACPVEDDLITMTNLPWQFSKSEIKKSLKLNQLLMINDYTAIAHAIPLLNADQKIKIGQGQVIENKPISICGPGTGLGVANLIPANIDDHKGQWISCGGEGGHVDFAPTDEVEISILRFLLKTYAHVSYEQLLSGLGLEQIYLALANHHQRLVEPLSAKEISTKALKKQCDLCLETLNRFCQILGAFAGNLALTLASFGGVYIAGGIVPRFIEFLKKSDFRKHFEQKGRFNQFNSSIATYVITEEQPGIIGASAYLDQHACLTNNQYKENTEEL